MQQINLKEMSLVELKSLAYDHLALIENSQKAIQLINQEIMAKSQAFKPELVENGTHA